MADPVLYSWGFLNEVVKWSRLAAFGAAIVGAAVTRDFRVPLSIAIGAAVDIVTIQSITMRAERIAPDDAPPSEPTGLRVSDLVGHMTLRVAAKAALLAAAAVLPAVLSFWGMVVGVLVVDTTILFVGSIIAAVRTFGSSAP